RGRGRPRPQDTTLGVGGRRACAHRGRRSGPLPPLGLRVRRPPPRDPRPLGAVERREDGGVNAPRRILIYRCGALGDTVVALPAMRAVREAFPNAELALMTANDGAGILWTDEVLRDFGWFASVVTYRARELASIRGLWGDAPEPAEVAQ